MTDVDIAWLTIASAMLTGLAGSGHCAVMCGGIATGFPAMAPRAGWRYVVEPNLGRVLGYAIAGAVAGALGHAIVGGAGAPWLRLALRVATGAVLVVVGLRLWRGAGRRTYPALGNGIWRALKPVQRRLLPAHTSARRIALGALWGWLPCGLSTTVLTAAWLQATPAAGATTMAAFGLGTLPVMLPLTWSGQQLGRRLLQGRLRTVAGAAVMAAGALTIAAPWLVASVPGLHGALAALGCLPPTA